IVGGGLNAGINVLIGVVAGRRIPAPVRGRVFGVLTAVGNGANMVGFLLGGLLLASVAPRLVMFGTGIAGIIVASLFLPAALKPDVKPDTAVEVGRTEPTPVG